MNLMGAHAAKRNIASLVAAGTMPAPTHHLAKHSVQDIGDSAVLNRHHDKFLCRGDHSNI